MICRVCHGSGHFFTVQNNRCRWFSCPSCNGLGTWRVEAPVKIRVHNPGNRALAKLNAKIDAEGWDWWHTEQKEKQRALEPATL